MKEVRVSLKQNGYSIVIGDRILSRIGETLKKLNLGRDAIIITNPRIARFHGKNLTGSLSKSGFDPTVLAVPDGEKSKSARTAFSLMERIAKNDVMKKTFIIAFGGGVVGDLAGYVASAYKRGIPYVQVPTTFLAQIDSAIGGKVGVDLTVGKNLVGSFYQPKMVFSDVLVLKTLGFRQLRNGLAEAIKYGAIYDQAFFRFLEKNYDKVLKSDPKILTQVVLRCSQIKAEVVKKDEKETKGIRTILNFGHTIGHAIEAAGKYSAYQHGEAIALGMRIAAQLSYQLKMCEEQDLDQLNRLLTAVGLPKRIVGLNVTGILKMMQHDKKFLAGKNRFVLLSRIGKVKVVEGIPGKAIEQAIRKYIQ